MSTMSRAGTAQYVSLKDKLTYLAQQHAELTIEELNGLPVSTMDYEPLWRELYQLAAAMVPFQHVPSRNGT